MRQKGNKRVREMNFSLSDIVNIQTFMGGKIPDSGKIGTVLSKLLPVQAVVIFRDNVDIKNPVLLYRVIWYLQGIH